MAQENFAGKGCLSFPAGADLSAETNQYRFVKLNASGQVVLVAAAGDEAAGVLQNKPKSTEAAEVAPLDGRLVKAQAGEPIAAGAVCTCDATGRLTDTLAAGNERHGVAVEAAGAAGDIITFFGNALGKE